MVAFSPKSFELYHFIVLLDPACGSGNFLTETYISLRLLENEVIRLIYNTDGQGAILALEGGDHEDPIKVSISQFYGIEINDFAVTVARTAMWIAESQMMKETESILNHSLDFFPLKTYVNIVEGNALRIDWNEVVDKNQLNYIIGNPPFVGSKYSSTSQKDDMSNIFSEYSKKFKKLDYVTSWYVKAASFIQANKNIKAAFVSTNSIAQGEQVSILWNVLRRFNIEIFFAHRTFIWENDTSNSASVYCIIIGIATKNMYNIKKLYSNGNYTNCNNISPYLTNSVDVIIESSSKPLFNQKKMIAPNKPCDYNHLKIEKEDYQTFKNKCPESLKWIKRMVGAAEFINNKERYCLWLVGISPNELKSMPMVMERVQLCKEARLKANTQESLRLANTPTLFREQINPESYLLIPAVSSENRKYIPIGFLDNNTIPVMGTLIIPGATILDFGIITSNVHMAWMRAFAGRLKSDYRYSKDIVYNNFPWPTPTPEQQARIEETAQGILDARNLYPDSSLADLYNELTMPPELRKAHQNNDKAVMAAYGFSTKMTEAQCVAELMKMYQNLVEKLAK